MFTKILLALAVLGFAATALHAAPVIDGKGSSWAANKATIKITGLNPGDKINVAIFQGTELVGFAKSGAADNNGEVIVTVTPYDGKNFAKDDQAWLTPTDGGQGRRAAQFAKDGKVIPLDPVR